MKTITILTLIAVTSFTAGYFTGTYKPASAPVTHQIPKVNPLQWVTNGSEAGTHEATYTVIRGTEDGENYSYSVILEADQEAYDFLTATELDTVLSGRYLSNNGRLTGN